MQCMYFQGKLYSQGILFGVVIKTLHWNLRKLLTFHLEQEPWENDCWTLLVGIKEKKIGLDSGRNPKLS